MTVTTPLADPKCETCPHVQHVGACDVRDDAFPPDDRRCSCYTPRAQQVRDAARGAERRPGKCDFCFAQRDNVWPIRLIQDPAKGFCGCTRNVCGICEMVAGDPSVPNLPMPSHACPPPTDPVSPGVGPPAESEDRELAVAVARGVAESLGRRFECLSDWARERYIADARVALDARAAHLARTATVAAVAPVAGPLVGNQQLRADVEHAFHELTTFAPMAFVDAALRTVDAHLASRALRPAREVAHETPQQLGCTGDSHSVCCDRVTAAIERDRAGGRR